MSYSENYKTVYRDKVMNAIAELNKLVEDHNGVLILGIDINEIDLTKVIGRGDCFLQYSLMDIWHEAYRATVNKSLLEEEGE